MGEEKRTFVDENLSGARCERCWMTDLVIRGSGVSGMEIDDPWRRVLDSLQTILNEEWEHLRYAVRDLDAQEGPSSS